MSSEYKVESKMEPMLIESSSITSDDFPGSEDLARRGALLLEEERALGVLATVKLHWKPLLICTRPQGLQLF